MEAKPPPVDKRIVALNRDLFFGVRLKQLGASLGYAVAIAPDAERFVELMHEAGVTLGIIDINASPDWTAIASDPKAAVRPPTLAFGPHKDVEGLRAAKAAGVTRVVSNGQFHKDAAGLISRYAGGETNVEADNPEELDEH